MKTIINTTFQSDLLTQLEKEVLHMMAYDYTLDEMILELKIKKEQIEDSQSELFRKLEVEHESALIRVAYERGVLVLYELERRRIVNCV